MGYTITRELTRDFATALADTRAALADNGFGVLTEIDMKATLKAKLDVDIPRAGHPRRVSPTSGVCRPPSRAVDRRLPAVQRRRP